MSKPYQDQEDEHLRPTETGQEPQAENGAEDAAPEEETAEPEERNGEDRAQLEARIKELEAAMATAKDQVLRAMADAENTRKRAMREREDAGKYAISAFARDLLDFSDNFKRALASIPEELRSDERINAVITGIDAMGKELLNTFEKHGIRKIDPMDELFNPNYHEVMFEAPGTGKPAGTIIQVVEPGYLIKDRLLRPARVGVAKGEDGAPPPATGHVDTQA